MADTCYNKLGVPQLIGLSFIAEAGFLSLAAVLILVAIVTRNAIVKKRQPLRTHGDIYAASLFFADVVHAIGTILELRWISAQAVWCGSYCSVQGALKQIGTTNIALSALAITVYTFSCLFLKWNPPKSKRVPVLVVTCVWLYSVLFAIIGYAAHPKMPRGDKMPLYVPAPYWCWLQSSVPLRMFGEYFWVGIALAASVLLYVPLFFLLRGKISVSIKYWHGIQYPSISRSTSAWAARDTPALAAEAHKMLLYPCAYAITVLPQIIVRWSNLDSQLPVPERPFAVTGAAFFLFSLSGLINVLLFLHTRPTMLGFGGDPAPSAQLLVLASSGCHHRVQFTSRITHPSASPRMWGDEENKSFEATEITPAVD